MAADGYETQAVPQLEAEGDRDGCTRDSLERTGDSRSRSATRGARRRRVRKVDRTER